MLEDRIVRFRARTIIGVLAIVLAVAVLLQLIWVARQVLVWVLIAVFLSLALNPAVDFFVRRGIRRRALAIGITYLIAFSVVAALGSAFIPTLIAEIDEFVEAVPQFVRDLTEGRGRLGFLQTRYQIVERVQEALAGVDASRIIGGAGTALAVTKGIVTAIVAVITIVVLAFFMLLEGPKWIDRTLGLFPDESRPRWERVGREIYRTVGGFVAGALTISVVAGTTSAIFLTVLGVSYAIALGLLVALLDLIPLAGATIATVVVSTIAFLDSGWTIGLVVFVFFVAYQQLENHVLYPLVYSRTVELSPLAILIAVLIGASLAGILGAIAAIPIAGTIQVALREWLRARREGVSIAEAPL